MQVFKGSGKEEGGQATDCVRDVEDGRHTEGRRSGTGIKEADIVNEAKLGLTLSHSG